MVDVKFESAIHDAEFVENGVIYERHENNKVVEIRKIPEFKIKNGEKKAIDKETYDYLREKGVLLTKKEKESIDKLRQKYTAREYNRAEYDSKPMIITDDEKRKIFNDLPFVV